MLLPKEDLYPKFMSYWTKHVQGYSTSNPSGVYAPMYYITQGGGKRVRPVYMLMVANLFSDDVTTALPLCFGVELFHNFTLLHDDIMDAAPLRRGRETVHEKWDTNTAILSGDLMMIESLRHFRYIKDHKSRAKATDYFLQGGVAVCEGQQLDVEFENRDDVQLSEYIEMIRLKTAALLAEGMAMAAMAMGATKEEEEYIRQFGYNIGIAFQIQDDILDSYGNPEKFGKKVGGDIAQNKKTYLYLRALELASQQTKKEILHCYSEDCTLNEEDKIKKVMSLFNNINIKKIAEEEKMNYTQKGFDFLKKLNLSEEKTNTICQFSLKLIHRNS